MQADAAVSAVADPHGPLPGLLFVLTAVTGLVDALSYLQFGHVFVANMTGNVVFLGFAAAEAEGFSATASLLAIAAFLVGALVCGRLGYRWGRHRGQFIAYATSVQLTLVAAALIVSLLVIDLSGGVTHFALVALLGAAMGLQSAVARRLAVPDLTTTVLTLTLTGLAADSGLAGGEGPRQGRRLTAIATMYVGAAVGAFLALHYDARAVLTLTTCLLLFSVIRAYQFAASREPWTVGP